MYQEVRVVRFFGNFAYIINEWSLLLSPKYASVAMDVLRVTEAVGKEQEISDRLYPPPLNKNFILGHTDRNYRNWHKTFMNG